MLRTGLTGQTTNDDDTAAKRRKKKIPAGRGKRRGAKYGTYTAREEARSPAIIRGRRGNENAKRQFAETFIALSPILATELPVGFRENRPALH